jgi:hypothetical protein
MYFFTYYINLFNIQQFSEETTIILWNSVGRLNNLMKAPYALCEVGSEFLVII